MATHKRVTSGSYSAMHTDHSDEIESMRGMAEHIIAEHPDATTCPREERKNAAILMCAAALLEVHDDTGISLDNFVGPLELVYEALWLIGKDRTDFLPNGV